MRMSDLYLDILHAHYLSYRKSELEKFVAVARECLLRITPQEVEAGLAAPGWRERLVAGWIVGVKKWEAFVPVVGKLLNHSEVVYAGEGYCFALARIANGECVLHLCSYLNKYLVRPDLRYDQHCALGALLWTDRVRTEARAQTYLGPSGLWETFLVESKMGGSNPEPEWLSGSVFLGQIAKANQFCEQRLSSAES